MSKWNFEKLTNDLKGKRIKYIQIINKDDLIIQMDNDVTLEVKLNDKSYLNENFDIN